MNNLTKIYLPNTLTNIDDSQLAVLNKIHEYYGTELSVSNNPSILYVKDGFLVRK